MTNWENKYRSTSQKLEELTKINKVLVEELREIKCNWSLALFSHFQEILSKHRSELDPTIVNVAATNNRQSLIYEINPKDVVCVKTEGKKKFIFLKEKIKNIEGPLHITDQVVVNRNKYTLENLCADLDILNFRLVMASDRAIVNVEYYHRFKKTLQLIHPYAHHKCKSITLGQLYINDYEKVKNHFDDLISLQRLSFRGIV
jgi:hypothetical protein